ncbi:MAG: protein arginine kinase [Lachnospiraceae bacterium]|nr:protein arginine kinase [Lachnospiraceae bacterium]
MPKWYEETTNDLDVVLSSRIRLARNLKNYNFSVRLDDEHAKELVGTITGCVKNLGEKSSQPFKVCHMNTMNDVEKASFVECHTITPLFAEKKQDTALLYSEDESISIMVNEEDHIQIQVFHAGMDMYHALEKADEIDDILSEAVSYAFDDKFGYLTTSPGNVGTGLKASYMVFLPALTMAGKIQRLADEVGKYGIEIRGIYGEGTKSLGYIYQISNQKTLGCSEAEIIDNLNQIVKQTIIQERKRREYLISMNGDEIEDKVYRSYGVLKYAKRLNTVDAMMLLAQLKLGIDGGLIRLKEKFDVHTLMMQIQPANLQKMLGKNITGTERDRYRAEFLNQKMADIVP